jgi:hypothetical protein
LTIQPQSFWGHTDRTQKISWFLSRMRHAFESQVEST